MGKRKKNSEFGEKLKIKSESSSAKNSSLKHGNQNNTTGNKKLSKTLEKPFSETLNLANEAKAEMASQSQNQSKKKHKNVNSTAESKEGQKSSTSNIDRDNRVIYINSNYRQNEIGDQIQNELLGLRQQSSTIKSASDLTESQVHVIKRQISRLQGGVKKKVKKRPKKFTMSIDDAAKELQLMIEKQKQKN